MVIIGQDLTKYYNGGYYELALHYSTSQKDERILEGIQAIWNHSSLKGEFNQFPVSLELRGFNKLYGGLSLSNGASLGCETMLVREKEGSDWLNLSIPEGMFELLEPKINISDSNDQYLLEINKLFTDIAKNVYAVTPFNFAVIGEEVSGCIYEKDLIVDAFIDMSKFEGISVIKGFILPKKLCEKLKIAGEIGNLSEELFWFKV